MKKSGLLLMLIASGVALLASCSTISAGSNTSSAPTSSISSSSELRQFTLLELSAYDGDEGGLAYVAVSGIVYDVTNADNWENGWHNDMHLAGTDATAVFATSPHSQALLDTLPIVGTLVA